MDLHHQLHSHASRHRRGVPGKHSNYDWHRCQAQPQTRPPHQWPKVHRWPSLKDQTGGPNPITAAPDHQLYHRSNQHGQPNPNRHQRQRCIKVVEPVHWQAPPKASVATANWNVSNVDPYTISYTATQADIDAGVNLVNTASVTTTQVPGPTTDTATTPVTRKVHRWQ